MQWYIGNIIVNVGETITNQLWLEMLNMPPIYGVGDCLLLFYQQYNG